MGPDNQPRSQAADLIRIKESSKQARAAATRFHPSHVCSVTFSKYPQARIERQSSLLRSIFQVPGTHGAAHKVQQLRAKAEMTRVIAESLISTA